MESVKKRRGRSARADTEECVDKSEGYESKGSVAKRGKALVGRYVRKEFVGCGFFPGKIISFGGGLYRIVYDDGDSEDLRLDELEGILLEEGEADAQIGSRKRKLDQLVGMGKEGVRKTPSQRLRQTRVASDDGSDQVEALGSYNGGVTGSNVLPCGEGRAGEGESVGFDGDLTLSSVVSDLVEPEEKTEDRIVVVSETVQSDVSGEKDDPVQRKKNSPAKVDVTSSITFEHSLVPEQRTSNDSSSVRGQEKEVLIEQISRPLPVPSRVERLRPRKTKTCRETQLSVDGSYHTTHISERTKSFSDREADSYSDSCDSRESAEISASSLVTQIPVLPPEPLLPQSSGDIAVPEQSVSSLFSVYNFLRSFSQQLFLSPFSIGDFVGSLNCLSTNSLLDAVHISLLRALKRHLEMLSSEGSERASKCLRHLDWSFLDTITWPIYLVGYLLIMVSDDDLIKKVGNGGEFCALSVSTKLSILQILCDHVIESAELRAGLDMRENTESEMDSDGKKEFALPSNESKSLHPSSDTSTYKEPVPMEGIGSHNSVGNAFSSDDKVTALEIEEADGGHDWNGDECRLCGMDGTLVCCDGCPSAYHSRCIGLTKALLPEGSWFCPECTVNRPGQTSSRIGKGLRGAEFFGVDPYNHIFFGTCNYLLVLEDSLNAEALSRYYNRDDIPKVLQVLCSSPQYSSLYSEICKGILQYWEIPGDPSFSNSATTEAAKNPPEEKAEAIDLSKKKEETVVSTPLCTLPVVETHKISNIVYHQIAEKNSSLNLVTQAVLPGQQQSDFGQISIKKMVVASETGTGTNTDQFALGNANLTGPQVQTCANTKICEHFETDFAMFKPQSYINQYVHGDFAASAAANLAVLACEDSGVSGANVSLNPKKFLYQNVSLQVKAFTGAAMHFVWPCSDKKLMEIPRERCGWCFSCKAPPTNRKGCLLNQAAQIAIKGAGRASGGLRPIKNSEGPLPAVAAYILYMEESLHGLIAGPFMNVNYRRQWRKQVEQSSTCRTLKLLLLELEENIRLVALYGGWLKLVDDCSVEVSAAQIGTCSTGTAQKRGPVGRWNRKSATSGKTDSSRGISNVVNWWRWGKLSKLLFKKGFLPSSIVKKAAREGGSRRISGILYIEGSGIPRRSQQLAWRAAVETCANLSQLALQVRHLDAHIRWDDLVQLEKASQSMKGSDADASAFRNARICAKKEEDKTIYLLDFGDQKHLTARVIKNVVEEHTQDGKELFWFTENHIPLYLIKEYEEKVSLSLSKKFARCQRRQLKACREYIFSYLVAKRDRPEKCTCSTCSKDVLVMDAVRCSTCQGLCHKYCTIASTSNREDKSKFIFTCYTCYHVESDAINENCEKPTKVQVASQGQEVALTTPSSKHMQRQNGYHHRQVFTACPEIYPKGKPSPNPNSTSRKKYDIEFGLIWNKENKPGAGTDFRIHNILRKGNSEMDPSKEPICGLCHSPYNPDLMYILCEICQQWFHADAIRLEESQIFEVVGFKCCKCRKKTRPRCPYMDPELLKKDQLRSSNKIKKGRRSRAIRGCISKVEVEEPTTPVLYSKPLGDGFEDEDDPLFSLERTREHNLQKLPIKRPKPEKGDAPVDLTKIEPMLIQKAETCPNPKKLPVRRRNIKLENDIGGVFPVNPPGYEEAATSGADLMSEETSSPPQVEWDFSVIDGSEGNATFSGLNDGPVENTGGVIEGMEFEPQTYFSFTELLASEDDRFSLEPFETDKAEGLWENGGASDFGTDLSACRICGSLEPPPDLTCENCRLPMHRHCSQPWDDSWRCVFCQGQQ